MIVVLADVTAVVGAVGSAVAAVAAVIAIVFAKQAADAGRDAVSETQKLRVEDDFREVGRAVWSLRQFADDARRDPDDEPTIKAMRHAQTRLRGALVAQTRIRARQEVLARVEIAVDSSQDPVTVYSATAQLIEDMWDLLEDWQEEQRVTQGVTHPPETLQE